MSEQMEDDLLEAIWDGFATRSQVAMLYAAAIRYQAAVDWNRVNNAIIDRWSVHALKWIKTEAWKNIRANERALVPQESSG